MTKNALLKNLDILNNYSLLKGIILTFLVCTFINYSTSAQEAETKTLRGIYKGESIFLSDPFASDGFGYCTDSVYLNKKLFKDVTISTTVEINLKKANLILGDSILIDIYHKPLCKPTHINPESILIESSFEFMRCLITGKVLNSNGSLIEKSNTIIFNSNRELEEFTTTNSNDGGYTLALKFDKVYEVVYEADGYQTKRVVIDLRNIPSEHKKSWELVANIRLDTITEIYNDSLLYELAVDKMAYSPTTKKMDWDTDYRKAMDRAFTYISESAQKSEQLLQAEIERQAEINTSKNQRLIIYSAIILIILILLFLIYVVRVSRQRKNDNETITQQNSKIEQQITIVKEAHKEITDSIAYAKRIQSAILPPIKLVKEYLQESFVLYKPKDVVAGDFYWFYNQRTLSDSSNQAPRYNPHSANHSVSDLKNSIETPFENTDENTILFAAADCTGHGVPGAMVSVVCNSALNRAVKEFNLSEPGEILTKTRDLVIEEFEKSDEEVKDGMDIALCSLQKRSASRYDSDINQNHSKSFVLKYAGAYNPLWIIRNGATEVEEIKAHKQAIGLVDNPEAFPTHEIQLSEGDAFYIFSDGYVDQFGGERGKKYKAPNFRKLLVSIQDKSMEEQKVIIDETFETWRGSLEQIDDVCIIGVRI